VDVLAVLLGRRRDHPEDVIDLHRPLGRLGCGHHDRRPAAGRARLDHEPVESLFLGVEHAGGELSQAVGLEVGQVLLARAGDRLLELVGQVERPLGASLLELAPRGAQLGLELRRDPARDPPPQAFRVGAHERPGSLDDRLHDPRTMDSII
jgi:hypothetical protein